MVSSSSTIYALIVTLLMAMFCGSLIVFSALMRTSLEQVREKELLLEKVSAGMRLMLSEKKPLYTMEETPVDLLTEEGCKPYKKVSRWGVYNLLNLRVEGKKNNKFFSALAGVNSFQFGKTNIYITDQRKALYLSGNALLSGVIALGREGIKRGYTDSQGYSREKLFEGTLLESTGKLPLSFSETSVSGNLLLKRHFSPGDSIAERSKFEHVSISRSFDKNCLVFRSDDTLYLASGELRDHIMVYSPVAIKISKDIKLSSVLVVSPLILVEDGFRGDCQFISSGYVVIGKNVHLGYPSAILHLNGNDLENTGGGVFIDSLSTFTGSILLLNHQALNNPSLLRCMATSSLKGFVFCETRADISGTLEGFLYAEKMVSVTSSSYRENYLVNGQISQWKQAEYFTGPIPDKNEFRQNVAKWLAN